MKTKKILILEDDLKTLSVLLDKLSVLEEKHYGEYDIAVTVLSEYTRVENYINHLNKDEFDLILLDRDCKLTGSFHILDHKFEPDQIISISSTPQWNELARKRGIEKIIPKTYEDLESFALSAISEIERNI